MARGDYVSTYGGAVSQGAASTVLAALAAGTSPGNALRARFPSLPGNVLGALVTNLSNLESVHVATALTRDVARATGIPLKDIAVDTGLTVAAVYTVIIYFNDSSGEERQLPVSVQNQPIGATEEQIVLAASAAAAVVLSRRTTINSPNTIAAVEALQEMTEPPEPSRPPKIVRATINPQH